MIVCEEVGRTHDGRDLEAVRERRDHMDSASRAAGATRPAKRARTMSASPAEAMLAHLEARGARFDPALRFRASGPGAGLGGFAARDIKKGEVVCALPLAMAVTSSAAERWWYGGGGADKPTTPAPAFVDGEFLLCMYLVAARRDLVSVPVSYTHLTLPTTPYV